MKSRLLFHSIFFMVLFGVLFSTPLEAESVLEKILRVSGISATPGQVKGIEEGNLMGALMLVDLNQNVRRTISLGGGYRSPVFDPTDRNILALKDGALIRIPCAGGQEETMQNAQGITKLLGFDRSDPDKLLVLFKTKGNDNAVGFLSLRSGQVAALSLDLKAREEREMLNHLQGWERVYGEVKLYPQERQKESLGGTTLVYSDVFLQRGQEFPVNISNCDGKNCGQPSLSHDGNLVVYVAQQK
ncbi:hypothetical protein SAMN04489760_10636 [Syntrophus gentianae]|uniref:WD40-like Beta Propeller Repeat n=1 Tax=Syntrophus gentianae TaxID=43775 RepID=A0A1H7WBG0_9BACT|nr:hypothetical protein [Syntrophus gentianae]SEM18425.1 hypothetical protein SAMN04489760_10636 [Syntrophus gentianae]